MREEQSDRHREVILGGRGGEIIFWRWDKSRVWSKWLEDRLIGVGIIQNERSREVIFGFRDALSIVEKDKSRVFKVLHSRIGIRLIVEVWDRIRVWRDLV